MITTRDQEVIKFIEKFKVAKTSTLTELFYPSTRVAQRRLAKIVEHRLLNRSRAYVSTEYMYYINRKPKQLRHKLILSNFYGELSKMFSLIGFNVEQTFSDLRADGFAGFKLNKDDDTSFLAFIEVEISNNKFNTEKYKKFLYTQEYKTCGLDTFPQIIAITNKKIDECEDLEIIQIKEDLSDVEVLKDYYCKNNRNR
ncbi:MAG: hypothetical protein FH753_00855 [Firmicutes bacterium]|nr:hypothetical protein [Bacillota bacterium]